MSKDDKPRAEHRLTVKKPSADGVLAKRIDEYISNLAGRNESGGAAQSAWWTHAEPEMLRGLMADPLDDFEARANEGVEGLANVVHPNARSGVIVLARAEDNGSPSLAILKLLLSDQQLARFDDEATGDDPIVEALISNVLPKPSEVKKGALLPHPDAAADARVLDEQLHEAADYWLKWLGLTARPKEPGLARLAITTVRSVVSQLSSEHQADDAIAEALSAKSAGTAPVSVKDFSAEVAKNAEVDENDVWQKMTQKEPGLMGPHLEVTPEALSRAEIIITLDEEVTVRGPARALAGRYRIRAATGVDGWVTELDSTRRPEVKQEIKRTTPRSRKRDATGEAGQGDDGTQ